MLFCFANIQINSFEKHVQIGAELLSQLVIYILGLED